MIKSAEFWDQIEKVAKQVATDEEHRVFYDMLSKNPKSYRPAVGLLGGTLLGALGGYGVGSLLTRNRGTRANALATAMGYLTGGVVGGAAGVAAGVKFDNPAAKAHRKEMYDYVRALNKKGRVLEKGPEQVGYKGKI